MRITDCTFGQVYANGKGCIFTSKTYDAEKLNENIYKSKSEVETKFLEPGSIKLDNKFFTLEDMNMKNSIRDKSIHENEKFNNFHIYLNNPKDELIQENYSNRRNMKSEFSFDISLRSPFVRVDESKNGKAQFKKWDKNPMEQKNGHNVKFDAGKNLIFKLNEPYKLIKSDLEKHVINNKFVHGYKDENSKNQFRKTVLPIKVYPNNNQYKIILKNTETLNYENINPFHKDTPKMTSVPVMKTDMSNANPGLKTVFIPSKKEFTFYALPFEKENEELKISHEKHLAISTKSDCKSNCDSEFKVNQPMQPIKPVEKPSLSAKVEPNPPTSPPRRELSTIKENDNKSNNSRYSELMKKVIDLDKQGKAKELEKFSQNISINSVKNSQSISSEPVMSPTYQSDESGEPVDEGELFQSSPGKGRSKDSTEFESLPKRNVLPNIYKDSSIPIDQNAKANKEKSKIKDDNQLNHSGSTMDKNLIPTFKQQNLIANLMHPVENSLSLIQNTAQHLSDSDESTGFPQQKSEDVSALLKANPPSYITKSVVSKLI
ncbi:uncharacterized protein [Chironomus tepperi]|uniref:uncharacterized protein n=1 Tax=Chironomus tepperi TaxID=113505 RepID=UPI00391FC9ED